MITPSIPPGISDVERISALQDPALRNLQITQCYHELSAVLARRSGLHANWCTFATWASKQAGQTIRKEDLLRLAQSRVHLALSGDPAVQVLIAALQLLGIGQDVDVRALFLKATDFSNTIRLSSEAVGRGNKKVYEEIGREFARFYATLLDDAAPDAQRIAAFCAELRPGDPPDGQEYLRRAFGHYYQALFEPDPKARAELILLANIEIGFHEQTRLQPEIAASLDAGFASSQEITARLLAELFPFGGWLARLRLIILRWLGRPSQLEQAIRDLSAVVRQLLRETLTDVLMTIGLPFGAQLRLGEDLAVAFPDILQHIDNPELRALLASYDPTPDSTRGSGALDWADLPDRLHFIIDFFRSYQENQDLFEPPYTPEQVATLKSGRLPAGNL